MTEKKKIRIIHGCALFCNVAIVMFTVYSICEMLVGSVSGNMNLGVQTFRYFTNLSNILVAVMTMFVIPFNINSIKSGKDELPLWTMICQFVGTASVTVTFLTVLFFLGPTQGFSIMFAGPCVFLHCVTPIFAIISTCLLAVGSKIPFKLSFCGLAPTVLYSIAYMIAVVGTKDWNDFYGFTFGGKMWAIPISLVGMYLATYAFSAGLWALQNVMHDVWFDPTQLKKSRAQRKAERDESKIMLIENDENAITCDVHQSEKNNI